VTKGPGALGERPVGGKEAGDGASAEASASARTPRHRTEALLALRTRRSREPVVLELLEATLSAGLLRATVTELLSEVTATLGLAG